MLGRVVGISFVLPFAYYASRGRLNMPGLKPKLLTIGGLIGCQGLIGWWMVKSGLEEPEFKGEAAKVTTHTYRTSEIARHQKRKKKKKKKLNTISL
jgi:cytochrome c oxidase assembly protein subunit 15